MARKTLRVVAAVIRRDGRYLISQRMPKAAFPLYWEFPGGKVEPGEQDDEALRREMLEEMNARIQVGSLLDQRVHEYPDFAVDFRAYRCTLMNDDLAAIHVADYRWVLPEELALYPFPPADEQAIAMLLSEGEEA